MKVNLGCGRCYIDGWVNVDANPEVQADVYMDAFEFVQEHGPEVGELYMGHFLEHLLPASATALLALIADRLPSGAQISAIVPDMRAVFAAYERGEVTNEELNERFVYSYEQPSKHMWCHDIESLVEVFRQAGYLGIEEIDPLIWEPVYWKSGPESRWQCGVRATVPPSGLIVTPPNSLRADWPEAHPIERPVTPDETLLYRISQLRGQLESLLEQQQSAAPAPPGEGEPVVHDAYAAGSMFERLPSRFQPLAWRLLPAGTGRRRFARFGVDMTRITRSYGEVMRREWHRATLREPADVSYGKWRAEADASRQRIAAQREVAATSRRTCVVQCVVQHRDDDQDLAHTLTSLRSQSWPAWRAIVIGTSDTARVVASFADSRMAFHAAAAVESDSAAAINSFVSADPGDFVTFVEAGDVLSADCFFELADRVWRDPLVDLVYWDDDLVDGHGRRSDPRFRPSWSPEVLLGANYVGSSFALRYRRFAAIGGLREGHGDAVWWDLLVRCGLDEHRVERIPKVFSHLLRRPEPTPEESVAVVDDHLARTDRTAAVTFEHGMVRVAWSLQAHPHVTVIIPTRHNRELMSGCLATLARTAYPSFDVIVVDNGGWSEENERWYAETFADLDLHVEWWTRPFNYSAVNNLAAAQARGEVLVFLNDDTEMPDPGWMQEMVGWAMQPGVGVVGAQLIGPAGEIQHGGVVLGLNGFADHLFQGMNVGSSSFLGPTTWYRNVLAVTGACLAVRRSLFEDLGGYDERFQLCGSDVALGLDAVIKGKRNVCTPFTGVRHLESATRGTHVPPADFFASYWRYQHWVMGGDPFFSPSLSLAHTAPTLRWKFEPTPEERMSIPLDRKLKVFRMQSDAQVATVLASVFSVTDADARSVAALHTEHAEPFEPASINWFLPDIDSPFYGGVNTILRLADYLARTHAIENRFVFWAEPNEPFFRSAIAAAFPTLADAPISFHDASLEKLELVPEADVAVATLWATAYSVAQFRGARRKFYMIQDFEPMFYPAGTLYALAEESYRLGLYGLCNTEHMLQLYQHRYGGHGMSFQPAVDPTIFHAEGRDFERTIDRPATVFLYARPGHWRNCWELASGALEQLKNRLGDRVRIVTAGSWARPEELGGGIEHLGLLDYRETGNLYRQCDVGVALTVSEHPSYLPLELMACGVPVVAFDNPAGHWLLHDGENSLLARRTVDALSAAIERVVLDPELGRELARNGLRDVADNFGSWDKAFSGVYGYLSDPEPSRAEVQSE